MNLAYPLLTGTLALGVAPVLAADAPPGDNLTEVKRSGGVSPLDAPADVRKSEAVHAETCFPTITAEVCG